MDSAEKSTLQSVRPAQVRVAKAIPINAYALTPSPMEAMWKPACTPLTWYRCRLQLSCAHPINTPHVLLPFFPKREQLLLRIVVDRYKLPTAMVRSVIAASSRAPGWLSMPAAILRNAPKSFLSKTTHRLYCRCPKMLLWAVDRRSPLFKRDLLPQMTSAPRSP